MGVGKEGCPDGRLDGHRSWHVHAVGGVHVDGGGHLHDILMALHPVHLDLPLDDGGVVGDGSLEHDGDRDGGMGSGGT